MSFIEVLKSKKYYFFLLFVCVTACFGTLIYAPIFDFADEFFPKRWSMMNALENGFWPFWSPYRSMGIPAHADPQSSVFYLPFWILALVGHYNPYFWGAEFIFHVYVAGCGFFCLSHLFSKNDRICFVAACCYMLSGVFTGNTQHYSWLGFRGFFISSFRCSRIRQLKTPLAYLSHYHYCSRAVIPDLPLFCSTFSLRTPRSVSLN